MMLEEISNVSLFWVLWWVLVPPLFEKHSFQFTFIFPQSSTLPECLDLPESTPKSEGNKKKTALRLIP